MAARKTVGLGKRAEADRKKARKRGTLRRGKVNKDLKVKRIPLWVTRRLFDPKDDWHLTDEGTRWLRKTTRALGLGKTLLSPTPRPRRSKRSIGKRGTTRGSSGSGSEG